MMTLYVYYFVCLHAYSGKLRYTFAKSILLEMFQFTQKYRQPLVGSSCYGYEERKIEKIQ